MKNVKKHFLEALVAVGLLASICVVAAAAAGGRGQVQVSLDKAMTVQSRGKELPLLGETGNRLYPIIYGGTVYLPVETLGESFNVTTEWDKDHNVLTIGGDDVSTLGGIPAFLNDYNQKSVTAIMLDIDDVEGRTRVECVALAYDDDELAINLGNRQKEVICLYGNQSGRAAHAVITDMDTGEVIQELDIPEGGSPEYQQLWLPVEKVSKIKVAGELLKGEVIH